jgi:hypothetical protein
MAFANTALAAVAIGAVVLPIAIHFLLRRKRAPIAFGAMQFLLAAYRTQQRRLKLEQLLLLLLRCAVVVLLGFAVGRPLWGSAGAGGAGGGPRTVVLVVDNSLAAQARDSVGETGLTRAVKAGQATLARLDVSRGDRAALVVTTQTGEGRGAEPLVMVPATPDVRAVERALSQLRATDAQGDVAGALAAAARATKQEGQPTPAEVVLLSELRSGAIASAGQNPLGTPVPALASDQAAGLSLRAPLRTEQPLQNVAVVDVRPLRPVVVVREGAGAAVEGVRVRLERWGGSLPALNVQVQAWAGAVAPTMQMPDAADTQALATATASFAAGATQTSVTLGVPVRGESDNASRAYAVVARLAGMASEQDAIVGDNARAAMLGVQRQLTIAVVSEGGAGGLGGMNAGGAISLSAADWLGLALAPQSQAGQLLSESDVVVRRVEPGELASAVTAAGGLPAALADVSAVFVCQPQLLSPQAWQTLARAREAGKPMVVVPPDAPPAAEADMPWARAMAEAFGLAWELSAGATASGDVGDAGEGKAIASDTTLAAAEDPLALLRPELTSLARSVRVFGALSLRTRVGTGTGSGNGVRVVLGLAGGEPLIVASEEAARATGDAKGPVVLWLAAPTLAWTDLPARPLMVPLVQELVRQIAARSDGSQRIVAGAAPVVGSSGAIADARAALVLGGFAASGETVVLATGSGTEQRLLGAGVWMLRSGAGAARGAVLVDSATLASDTSVPSPQALTSWLAGPGWRVEEAATIAGATGDPSAGGARVERADVPRQSDMRISLVLFAIALAGLLLETVFARFLSHARPTGVSRDGAVAMALATGGRGPGAVAKGGAA